MRIYCQVVRCAWKRQHLARIARVRRRNSWQGIDVKLPGGWEVGCDIIGILFGKPDRIVGSYQYPHNAGATVWRSNLREGLCTWIKNCQVIMAHFSKPEASFVVNCWPHNSTIGLG